MNDEITFKLRNPLSEEDWDMITDVDMNFTDSILFNTKHGNEVTFVKQKIGHWILVREADDSGNALYECSECHKGEVHVPIVEVAYCWNCGAKMAGDNNVPE